MSRRIMQVAVFAEPGAPHYVYAVADDGTLWTTWCINSDKATWTWREWEQIPALPDTSSSTEASR